MGLFSSIGGSLGSTFGLGGMGAGSALGSVGDYFLDRHNASKAYKTERKDAIQFWNMQNEYNDPSAQMARLQAAGLNPMLVYSGGNVTGNSSSSISAPSMDASSYASGKYGQGTDKFTRLNMMQQMQNTTDQGSLENQLKQVQLEKARWELDNLKSGRNTNGVVLEAPRQPLNVTAETTIDEIMSNPDLTPLEKQRAVNLIQDLQPKPTGMWQDAKSTARWIGDKLSRSAAYVVSAFPDGIYNIKDMMHGRGFYYRKR